MLTGRKRVHTCIVESVVRVKESDDYRCVEDD